MATTAAALRQAIRSVAKADPSALTDRDLVRRFVDNDDQAAFTAIVNRHSGMVLGVCRRALPTVQDAEDACQATFLVLARKARSGRWQASLANWLYDTARKVAHNARVAAQRRSRREARAAIPESVAAVDRITGRELLAILDTELDKLPPRYREPLVLCYLEGLTRDEASGRLGIAADTLKVRIHRGRTRLHDALTKSGCALGAGLLALAATSPAGASPPRLAENVLASASGKPPATVAALAEGIAVNGIMNKMLLASALIAALVVGGLGLGGGRSITAAQRSAGPAPAAAPAARKEAKEQAAEKPAEIKTRTITGKVVDPEGKPVAGAEMVNLPIEGSPTIAGKTAEDGTFRVTVALKVPGSWLFPRLAGFASAEYLMPAGNTPAEKTFKLVKDTPIHGRVIDTQGKPVAGVSLVVRHIGGFANDSLDDYLAAWKKRDADSSGPQPKWSVHFSSKPGRKLPDGNALFATTTDKDGRFEIANVGPERLVDMLLTGPGIAQDEVVVLTRTGFDPTPYNAVTGEKLRSRYAEMGYHPMLHSPQPTIVAEAEKPIGGVVKETVTGKPLAGVQVHMRQRFTLRLPDLAATTDAAGRYEMHGVKKAEKYEVYVHRDPKTALLGRTVKALDTPAYAPATINIGLAKGIVLTGRVLDDSTKKPVPGFACAGVLFDNEYVAKKPEFDSPDCYEFAHADKDGVFRTVVPPGRILLMGGPTPTSDGAEVYLKYEQIQPDPKYPQYFDSRLSGFRSPGGGVTVMQGQYCKVLNLDPEQKEVKADVILKRAATFTIKVQGPDGKPATDVLAAGTTSRDWMYATPCKDDTCTIYGLDIAKPRTVVFYERKRNLAAVVTVTGKEKEPVIVKLGPLGSVKGILVDANGKPIASAAVGMYYTHRVVGEIDQVIHGNRRFDARAIETNAAGEFTIDSVVPGEEFSIVARKNDRFLDQPDRNNIPKFTVKAQERTDAGKVMLKLE